MTIYNPTNSTRARFLARQRAGKGRLRFCGEACRDGYREDQRCGVFTLPRTFAQAGCCMYCGSRVPTNAERRNEPTGVAS